ncbi:cellulose biosynthesis protein BcsQ [Pectobacterium sp. CHL-2024]|uniref:cellulose biosynthesis protein BcsQ n=1 Tax=Pectobacterium sp. CHL-2024 TaxID=3377079 RepID=UPI003813B6BF
MPVIALQGIRGGVGTTSIAAALGWAFQRLGESALVIDFSPDNLLRINFNMPFEQRRGWARAEADGTPWQTGAMQYLPGLDFLPFGRLNTQEIATLQQHYHQHPALWQNNLAQLSAAGRHRWILIDVPADNSPLTRQALATANTVFQVVVADANCHSRLHQQALPRQCHFLVNQFSTLSTLQQDLHQLWLHTLSHLLPLVVHRDEALAESLMLKQPLGECRPDSVAAEEIMTLANWCLIHVKEIGV